MISHPVDATLPEGQICGPCADVQRTRRATHIVQEATTLMPPDVPDDPAEDKIGPRLRLRRPLCCAHFKKLFPDAPCTVDDTNRA